MWCLLSILKKRNWLQRLLQFRKKKKGGCLVRLFFFQLQLNFEVFNLSSEKPHGLVVDCFLLDMIFVTNIFEFVPCPDAEYLLSLVVVYEGVFAIISHTLGCKTSYHASGVFLGAFVVVDALYAVGEDASEFR